MENKLKKKSINTVIYLLLAAMLVCVVLISVYTIASKTPKTNVPEDTTASVIEIIPDVSATPDDTVNALPDTDAAVDVAVTDPTGDETVPVASTENADIPTSTELRYFVLPVSGSLSKGYEVDVPVYSLTMNDYRAHTGIDLTAPLGTMVVSASTGTVSRIWNDPMMGKSVTIDHGDGIYTTYMNLAEDLDMAIEVGARVSMGQAIGAVGETALIEIAEEPHLHLEMKVGGEYVNPLDYISVGSNDDSVYE